MISESFYNYRSICIQFMEFEVIFIKPHWSCPNIVLVDSHNIYFYNDIWNKNNISNNVEILADTSLSVHVHQLVFLLGVRS